MTKKLEATPAERYEYTVFKMGRKLMLPSYDGTCFVQPGHTKDTPKQTFSADELRAAGYQEAKHFLWVRG